VIGGSAGIGLETARRARLEGAKLILTGRNAERLQRAASELDALTTAASDATDPTALERFFRDLPTPIDHVMVTAGRPYYGRLVDMDVAQARRALDASLLLVLQVARNPTPKARPGGTLLFMGGTGGRRPAIGLGIASTITFAQHGPHGRDLRRRRRAAARRRLAKEGRPNRLWNQSPGALLQITAKNCPEYSLQPASYALKWLT
jgi:NADP-dependent 3-hydroxy acid dehydrogenase YdfG